MKQIILIICCCAHFAKLEIPNSYNGSHAFEQFYRQDSKVCGQIPVQIMGKAASRLECHLSCGQGCAGVSFNKNNQECVTYGCNLGSSPATVSENTECFTIEKHLCSDTQPYGRIDLSFKVMSYSSSSNIEADISTVLDNDPSTCFATTNEQSPWWGLDLGADYFVQSVTIKNKGKDSDHRQDVEVRLGKDLPSSPLFNVLESSVLCEMNSGCEIMIDPIFTFTCQPCAVHGRYLLLRTFRNIDSACYQTESNILSVCEIEIYGCPYTD